METIHEVGLEPSLLWRKTFSSQVRGRLNLWPHTSVNLVNVLIDGKKKDVGLEDTNLIKFTVIATLKFIKK